MSQPPPASLIPFTKPWLDYSGQLQLLVSRGLAVPNPVTAQQFLSHINYYRLSGYCAAFEAKRHVFLPGATFDQVRQTYEFDLAMRDVLSEALEVVEVDLRTATGYHFGQKYGAYGHTDPASFFRRWEHAEWLAGLREEVRRSKESFVDHFRRTYTRFPDLPVWIGTEIMSFGMLSWMLKMIDDHDVYPIAVRYGFKAQTLKSWTHHLSHVRNLCAHHARVWNRKWSVTPQLPPMPGWRPTDLAGNDRLAATLLILYRMLLKCPAIGTFAADWKARVDHLLTTPPPAPDARRHMGMTLPLAGNPLWK